MTGLTQHIILSFLTEEKEKVDVFWEDLGRRSRISPIVIKVLPYLSCCAIPAEEAVGRSKSDNEESGHRTVSLDFLSLRGADQLR